MLQVLELRVAPCHGTRARCGHRTTPGTLRELKPLPSVKWQQLKWASAKSTRSPQKASSLGGTLQICAQMVRFVCIYHWVYGSMIHCCFKSHPTHLLAQNLMHECLLMDRQRNASMQVYKYNQMVVIQYPWSFTTTMLTGFADPQNVISVNSV